MEDSKFNEFQAKIEKKGAGNFGNRKHPHI